MIIPFGSEKTTVRRLPWVTFTIMGLCLLVFIPTHVLSSSQHEEMVNQKFGEIFEYIAVHPYLELDSRFFEFVQAVWSEEQTEDFKAYLEAVRVSGSDPPMSERKLAEQQEQLDLLVEQMFEAWDEVKQGSFSTLGLIPADIKAHTLITYQFLHGGWLHLFGNMLFLFVTAPFIEDVWGRLVFPVFYLLAGIISAVMYAVHYPDSTVPLIGASGAVAGAMGAFLVRFWTTKIKFFVWMIIFWGPFKGPAWVAFPIWFVWELLQAEMWDTIAPGSGGSGVAHWAHVWGFGFGLVVAYGIKHYRVEERYIDKAIESKITLVDNTAVEQAMEVHSQGRTDEAFGLLQKQLRNDPYDVDAAVAAWTLAQSSGRPRDAVSNLVRVIRREVRSDDPTLVLSHWQEVLSTVPDLKIEPVVLAKISEILIDHGLFDGAHETLDLARSNLGPDTASAVLARLARMAGRLDSGSAGVFAVAALEHPETHEEIRSELESLVQVAPPPSQPVLESATGQQEPSFDHPQLPVDHPGLPVEQPHFPVDHPGIPGEEPPLEPVVPVTVAHTLQAMAAVPTGISGERLNIEVGGVARTMRFDQVQAVGVGGVQRGDQRPYLVVDLMLDPPWSDRATLRVLRIQSTDFDPRRLMGEKDSMTAFRQFLDETLKISEAVPLPDPDAARGDPFRMFGSLEAYEYEVLGIGK